MPHFFFARAFGHCSDRRGRSRGRSAAEAEFDRFWAHIEDEILAILWDSPRRGVEVMRALYERTGVRPTPTAVYPALQFLADSDLVRSAEVDGKAVYALTETGSAQLAQREGQHAR